MAAMPGWAGGQINQERFLRLQPMSRALQSSCLYCLRCQCKTCLRCGHFDIVLMKKNTVTGSKFESHSKHISLPLLTSPALLSKPEWKTGNSSSSLYISIFSFLPALWIQLHSYISVLSVFCLLFGQDLSINFISTKVQYSGIVLLAMWVQWLILVSACE